MRHTKLSLIRLYGLRGLLLAAVLGVIGYPAESRTASGPTLSPRPVAARAPEPAQEITLGSLGLAAQGVYGPSGTVAVSIPPPLGPLAGSGSFVRVFFTHSPLLGPDSSITLLINAEPLTTMRLDATNAAGSFFETRVPAFLLRQDGPNMLEARFALEAAGPAAAARAAAYARLDPQTLLHYQLYGTPGSRPLPKLDSYPFPWLGGGGPGRLGLVLPEAPTDGELRAALRLVTDLGRRAYTQHVAPEVVTRAPMDWLKSAEAPAVLVGTWGRLPVADAVLKAAGFSAGPNWIGPGGEMVGRTDGLVVPALSPWDGQTPVLLISGATDEGLARAVDSLALQGQPTLTGQYAIVAERRAQRSPERTPRSDVTIVPESLGANAARALGAGSHMVTFPFALPPVDIRRPAFLDLRLSHSGLGPGSRSNLEIQLNSEAAAHLALEGPGEQEELVRVQLNPALFRSGLNTLTFSFRLAGDGSAADHAPGGRWARVAAGARMALPPPPSEAKGLEQLPEPMFGDPAGVLVVVGGRDDSALSLAAWTLAALGSRTTAVPALDVTAASDLPTSVIGGRSLIAVGTRVGSGVGEGALAPIRRSLPRPSASNPGPGAGWSAIYERRLAASSPHHVLWIEGTTPDLLGVAAAGLYRHPLTGTAIAFDAAGRPRLLEQGSETAAVAEPTFLVAVRALTAVAAGAMLLTICWHVVRR